MLIKCPFATTHGEMLRSFALSTDSSNQRPRLLVEKHFADRHQVDTQFHKIVCRPNDQAMALPSIALVKYLLQMSLGPMVFEQKMCNLHYPPKYLPKRFPNVWPNVQRSQK
jgi:hypothetical protein